MDEDESKAAVPITMTLERRRSRSAELSASEIMKILRKRAAKAAMRNTEEAITVKIK